MSSSGGTIPPHYLDQRKPLHDDSEMFEKKSFHRVSVSIILSELLRRFYSLIHSKFIAGEEFVTCGSVIKISHAATGYELNSESKNLNSGSGQQLVTFVKKKGTQNTLWWVRAANNNGEPEYPPGDVCQLAEPLPCGSTIRLTHMDTLRNLHSHGVKSVLSHQQEVSAFGDGDGNGDGGDDWKVECSGKYWKQGESVRLYHMDTGKYLGSSKTTVFNQQTCGHQCPIMG